jgi:xanthine dehydrogenase accessory factor
MAETSDSHDPLEQSTKWLNDGKQVSLATVIGTWGSSPRPVGSQLAVNDSGAFVGSVSGGCIEGSVIGEGLSTITDGKIRILKFGVTNEQAWEVGLACGGDIRIMVERIENIETIVHLSKNRPIARIINLTTKQICFVTASDTTGELKLNAEMQKKARSALRDDRSKLQQDGADEFFIQAFNPALRCAIIGAVHISQALVPMAQISGFDVTVIDPRDSFATQERFPNVTINDKWPDDAMRDFNADSRAAVITLTHDPKLDDPALEVALTTDAFYIGSLGSRKTHASRIERLIELGFSHEDLARIHAPVGFDLGATSPAEIAVTILAQMIAAKHGRLTPI